MLICIILALRLGKTSMDVIKEFDNLQMSKEQAANECFKDFENLKCSIDNPTPTCE